jgi:hypothetical protein
MRQKGHRPTPIIVTPDGARRLVEAAGNVSVEASHQRTQGTIDGWIWSRATMMMQPDQGREFRASVVDERLQGLVAELIATPGRRVTAEFDVVTTYPRGDVGSARRSYVLTGIEGLAPQPSLEDVESAPPIDPRIPGGGIADDELPPF